MAERWTRLGLCSIASYQDLDGERLKEGAIVGCYVEDGAFRYAWLPNDTPEETLAVMRADLDRIEGRTCGYERAVMCLSMLHAASAGGRGGEDLEAALHVRATAIANYPADAVDGACEHLKIHNHWFPSAEQLVSAIEAQTAALGLARSGIALIEKRRTR